MTGASDPLDQVREAAMACTACDLHKAATQTVFGSGRPGSPVMLVGEQPGDKEDLAGKPFVGPAGKLLDRALQSAGIDADRVYVTNVVKHFKFSQRGKVRLHKKPDTREVSACMPWFESELELVKPRVVVCLGATAAQALLGPRFRVTKQRGTFVPWNHPPLVTATVHPASILRTPDERQRELEMESFVKDLSKVAEVVNKD